MATRYVGIGGNDGNSGLTWALRKLTLNGAEDTPVVAGDLVYVGPGCYREELTVDVSGGAGTEIVYIGDITGEHTDGVGGVVRVTGSDNDQTKTRNFCITAGGGQDYRTFRGFTLDMYVTLGIRAQTDPTNWIVEDCAIIAESDGGIRFLGDNQANNSILRCIIIIIEAYARPVLFSSAGGCANASSTVQNCIFICSMSDAIECDDVGGVTVRNCTFYARRALKISDALPGGYTACTVNNSIIVAAAVGLEAQVLGEIVENYNTFYGNNTDRTNVNVGANSETYPPLFAMPLFHSGALQASGFKFPWWFGSLSEWSAIRAITGSNEPSEDLLGITRPVTASKNSWGACQFMDMERETGTVHAGSVSMCLHDAGRHQIWVPVANESTTISVYVYREANYAGNNPQMIIKQPGQADDVTTDAAAASQWNLLTTTLTPAADPPYVVVELVSRNTAGALAYEVFFDDLVVN